MSASILSSSLLYLQQVFLVIAPSAAIVLGMILILLIVISFLVSGSEVAFFGLQQKEVNLLKTHPQPSYKRIVSLLEQPNTLMASILITNIFVNIGIVLISNLLLHDWLVALQFKVWAVVLIKIAGISILLILMVEILPKVWAAHHKTWFASNASLVIEVFHSIFYGSSKRLIRYYDKVEKTLVSESEMQYENSNLDYAIDMLPESEASNEEKLILKGIRKFGDTEVKQIMRTRLDVSGVEYNQGFKAVKESIAQLHYSRLPVYKNNLDEPVGILHTKDLIVYLSEPDDFDWHKLIREPYFVHEQKFIEDLMQEFLAKRKHFAIVVDEFGGTSGIVTLEDIMEEVIGDIKDEFDDEESVNKKIDNYNFIFEGKMMIGDACKAMGLSPDTFDTVKGDADSIAGLVLEIAGDFPVVDSSLINGDFTFIPLVIEKNRIETVKITITPRQEIES